MVVQLQGSRASCGHSCAVFFCHAITFDGLALLKVGKSRKQFSFPTHFYKINKKKSYILFLDSLSVNFVNIVCKEMDYGFEIYLPLID